MVGYFIQAGGGCVRDLGSPGSQPACGYVGGADVSAPRKRGKTAYVNAYETGEQFGLHIAKDGELGGELLDGAMALAQLDAGQSCRQRGLGLDRSGGRHEAIPAQRRGQCLRLGSDVGSGQCDLRRVAAFHPGETFDGERADCFFAGHCLELLKGEGGDIEVIVAKAGLALRAEDVAAGGTPSAGAGLGHALDLNNTAAVQMIKMPAYRSGRETEHVTELRRADRPVLKDSTENPIARTLVGVRHRHSGHVAAVSGGTRRSVPGKRHSSSIGHGIHNTIMS